MLDDLRAWVKAAIVLLLFGGGYGTAQVIDHVTVAQVTDHSAQIQIEGRQGVFNCQVDADVLQPYDLCTQGNKTAYLGELLIEPEMRGIP